MSSVPAVEVIRQPTATTSQYLQRALCPPKIIHESESQIKNVPRPPSASLSSKLEAVSTEKGYEVYLISHVAHKANSYWRHFKVV